MLFTNPVAISRVLRQVGVLTWLSWVKHFFALALYTAAHFASRPLRPLLRRNYRTARWAEAWAWGSGQELSSAHLRAVYAAADAGRVRREARRSAQGEAPVRALRLAAVALCSMAVVTAALALTAVA